MGKAGDEVEVLASSGSLKSVESLSEKFNSPGLVSWGAKESGALRFFLGFFFSRSSSSVLAASSASSTRFLRADANNLIPLS